MSMTPEQAQLHANASAVTCCRAEAGTVITSANLEQPEVVKALENAGFVVIPPDCLTIAEVLGATLRATVEGFTPLSPETVSGIQTPMPTAVETARPHPTLTRQCLRKYFRIDEVKRGDATVIDGRTLYIRHDVCHDAIRSEALVTQMTYDIITPGQYGAYSHSIMDVQPIAVKESGDIGSGVTRVLDGVVVVITGTDELGAQLGEFGSSEGPLDRTIMWGRPGCPDPGDILIKTHVTIKANMAMQRPGPLAAHRATDVLTQEIRAALTNVEERWVVRTETLLHSRRVGQKKVAIIKEIMGQGAMHDNLLMPHEPVGTRGARANVDLGNLPIIVSPLHILDGSIHSLTCVGPASKETSRHYWREPLVQEVMQDDELDLCAVILVGSPQVQAEKVYVSKILGMTVEALDLDGAIVTTEGFGNNHIDFASHIEQIGQRGIPVVGMTYAAVQGQLVVGNAYMDALIELNKSEQGIENAILGCNSLTTEDALRAIAMLKAKMAGEAIVEAERAWNPQVKLRNIRRIEHVLQRDIALSAHQTSLLDP